jgi:light-regulated signal transduction histidine kinase (bacteriophytochrome)
MKKERDKGKVIHDINNHLTALNMSVELLLKNVYGELEAKQKKCIKGVISESKKVQKLLQKLKD